MTRPNMNSNTFELVIESRDVYTYHGITWYIDRLITPSTALASVVNARDPSPKVLTLARGYGYIESQKIWYACEESSDAYCTDSRPEPWRRVILKGHSHDHVKSFVVDALREYREFVASLKASDGVTVYAWDDHDGWVSVGDAPRRTLESLVFPDSSAGILLEELKTFVTPEAIQRYAELNVPMIKIVMLHGVPGSGKTSLVRCLASELNMNIANFSGEDPTTFSEALMHVPARCLVSVEDIDCLLGNVHAQREKRGFGHLLAALDGVTRKEPLIVCITTNVPGSLDIAVRRRIDHCLEFKYATKDQACNLIRRFFPVLEDPSALWTDVTSNGHRKTTMATLQKFLVRSLKYGSPWALLDDDPAAFTSLLDVVHGSSTDSHMYM